jgi:hypothetical protein
MYKTRLPWVGLAIIFEWHLVWAASSGMETMLLGLMILAVFLCLLQPNVIRAGLAGLIIGVSIWVRPDALTLIGPLLFLLVLKNASQSRIIPKQILAGLLGVGLPLSGYILFNLFLAGRPWPNTFYAKQAEYSVLQQIPLFLRYLKILALPLVGAGAILLPGFVYKVYRSIVLRDWFWLSAILWWLGYSLIYAFLLPVTYQHGRYLIPAMPVYFLLGLTGTFEGLSALNGRRGIWWAVTHAWPAAMTILLLVFWGLGAQSYARDVAVINTEMVAAAKWIQANTGSDELIAVHDIGAVGYFSQRKIIDLAGLITTEVVPFIRDEQKISRFLTQQGAAYLMTFPEWYPALTSDLTAVYQSGGAFSPEAGGENMTVYRWNGN